MTCWLCGFETTELATNAKTPTCKNDPCQICAAVADVDEEIDQAVATLRRLIAKRCDLRSEQNHIHGSLIHRLPVELRNYIFELVPTRDECSDVTLPFTRQGARMTSQFELTSICRSWRDTAWSNPSLWSTLRIVLGKSDVSSWIDFVHDRILRSQPLPLTLYIKIIVINDSKTDRALQDLASVLYHRIRRLRIFSRGWNNRPVSFLNPTVSPETIDICGISLQSLRISWDHLTFAKVECVDLDEVRQLFQHALQMTSCHVGEIESNSHQMPPIIHQRLKSFTLRCSLRGQDVAALLLGSLTLPCLQEFDTNNLLFLTPAYLPALVHRSSCPLTGIKFRNVDSKRMDVFYHLRPLSGVTDLFVEDFPDRMEIFLFGEYFPDLRRLTCRIAYFQKLWDRGVISKLIDRNRPRQESPNALAGRLRKILVVDCRPDEVNRWNSNRVGIQLKALHSSIILREGGFEILITEDLTII